MASSKSAVIWTILLLCLCEDIHAKLVEDVSGPAAAGNPGSAGVKIERDAPATPEVKAPRKAQAQAADGGGAAMLFADELKVTLERYLFGICPQTFKMQLRSKNATLSCDLDTEQQDLAGRFATLALRAHSAARSDCSRLGAALANTLGEIARTAANRHALNIATAEANKKRKLSKAAKAKIEAKQRTALAVKKKAAAAAAKMAAKMAAGAS